MKQTLGIILFAVFLTGCTSEFPIDVPFRTLSYLPSPAGTINVRGQIYEVERVEGIDKETKQVVQVEFRTHVNGQVILCLVTRHTPAFDKEAGNACSVTVEWALDRDTGGD